MTARHSAAFAIVSILLPGSALLANACSVTTPSAGDLDAGADGATQDVGSDARPPVGRGCLPPCVPERIDPSSVVSVRYEVGTFYPAASGAYASSSRACLPNPGGTETNDRLSVDLNGGTVRAERCLGSDAGVIDFTIPIHDDSGANVKAFVAKLEVVPVALWNDGMPDGFDGERHTLFLQRTDGGVTVMSFQNIGSGGPKLDYVASKGFFELVAVLYELAGLRSRW